MRAFILHILSVHTIFEVSVNVKIHFGVLWIYPTCSLATATEQIMTVL